MTDTALPDWEPNAKFAKRIGVNPRTPKRWDKDRELIDAGWPLPAEVNGFLFRNVPASLDFLLKRALTSLARPTKPTSDKIEPASP
jgi:hypothetical protein